MGEKIKQSVKQQGISYRPDTYSTVFNKEANFPLRVILYLESSSALRGFTFLVL